MISKDLFERALKVSPGGVHSPVRAFKSVGGSPLFFKSAKGAYLFSVEGGEYIDFCQSFGPLILGHLDPDVLTAVEEGIHKAWTFGACEPYSLELSEWIVENIAYVEKLRFVSSGTEAVMSALRLARAATGRQKILKFEGCYHGHVDSLLVKSGSGLAGTTASDSAGVSQSVAAETLLAKLGDQAGVEQIFNEHGKDIAAIIVEPLPANFGLLQQDNHFLQFLRKISTKNDSLLIFDEVISGFRVALGGMAELTGITPDLVTYGKVIGGGFPVGCYGGRADLMEQIAPMGPVYQAGTLSANPIGMIAGLATLKKMKHRNVIENLNQRVSDFVDELRNQIQSLDLPFKISSVGSLFWFHNCQQDNPSSIQDLPKDLGEKYKNFFYSCLNEGIYLAPSGYEVAFMSWAHDEKVMVEAMIRFRSALEKLKEA